MKLRTGEPWMPAPDYSRSLRGLTLNLLVRDIAAALPFHREVLGAEVVYHDPDFAVLRRYGIEWTLHADRTYDKQEAIEKAVRRFRNLPDAHCLLPEGGRRWPRT